MHHTRFTLDDQIWFADISGDSNPIHVNPIYARKSLFGEVIVHGVHLVIYSLNEFYDKCKQGVLIEKLNTTFLKPVKLNQEVTIEFEEKSDSETKIRLFVDGLIITVIEVVFSKRPHIKDLILKSINQASNEPELFEVFEGCKSLSLGAFKQGIDSKYSNLKYTVTENQLLNLFAITRIVGMKSPGLNSIFSSFALNFKLSVEDDNIDYSIKSYKENYSRLVLALESATVSGSLVAFVRPSAKETLSAEKANTLVQNTQFYGQRALIIGGSRGLGAITTKLLRAGGADILFSYHKGKLEAEQIVNEVNDGKVECFQIDVTSEIDEINKAKISSFNPTHIYYYVTPFIFSTNKGVFNFEAFVNFADYYLKGFYELIQICQQGDLSHVLYPSSVAIDDLVENMIEYSCAKSAGELLCDFLTKMNPKLRIYKPRFPRLETDQTQSLLRVEGVDTNNKMLETILTFVDL